MKYDAARIDELRSGGMGLLEAKKRARYEHLLNKAHDISILVGPNRTVDAALLSSILVDLMNEIFNEA